MSNKWHATAAVSHDGRQPRFLLLGVLKIIWAMAPLEQNYRKKKKQVNAAAWVSTKEQAPRLGQTLHLAQFNFASSISPRSNLALYILNCFRVSISSPSAMVPPVTMIAGTLTRAHAHQIAGHPFVAVGQKHAAVKGVTLAWARPYRRSSPGWPGCN